MEMRKGTFHRVTKSISHEVSMNRAYWLGSFAALIFCTILFRPAQAQQLVGTYTSSAPEAALMFLDPGTMNPAVSRGILGLLANPAALHTVQSAEVSLAVSTRQTSTGRFQFEATDSTEYFDAISLDAEAQLHENGGIGTVGLAKRFGALAAGIAVMQPRTSAIQAQAQGLLDLSTHFELDEPLTRNEVPDLPVESIPVRWDVRSQTRVLLQSAPGEISISVRPVIAGLALRLGPLALGGALKYFHITSGGAPISLTARVQGEALITGSPYGLNPLTGQPWGGTLQAAVTMQDTPLRITNRLEVSGSRWAGTLGSTLDLKVLKIGLTFERGLRGTVEGSYEIETIHTTGLPEEVEFTDIAVEVNQQSQVSGNARLDLNQFEKDTLRYAESGSFEVEGYTGFSVGINFLFLGVFAGGEIPSTTFDLGAGYFGAYAELPLVLLPVKVRAGFFHRTDFFRSVEDVDVPLRSVTHVGLGTTLRLPLHRWIGLGKDSSNLSIAARSSLVSLAFESVKEDLGETRKQATPKLGETLALSFGLQLPL